MSTRSRLHVKVSRGCNNNCLFCLDDRPKRVDVEEDEVAALLAAHAGVGEVLFTCGEPTVHPRLPWFVSMARSAGYRSVGLVTNGRRLSYPSYCDALLDAGLTEATVSIHAADPRTHDALVRSPGAHAQTLAGLDHLLAPRDPPRPRVISSTVVCRPNVARLRATLELLSARGVDAMVLNVIEPLGEARGLLDSLIVPYPEMADRIAAALVNLPGREGVVVEGLPLCLCGPFLDRVGVREEILLREGERLVALPPSRNHVKPEECTACLLSHRCPGIFAGYVDHRGMGEIRRVT